MNKLESMGDDNFGSYQNKNDLVRGTIGMEFDADRYTVPQKTEEEAVARPTDPLLQQVAIHA